MKLTSVEIHPDKVEDTIEMSFRDPGSVNPYNVKTIVGLDADSITPRYYTGSGNSKFQEMSLEGKDVVFQIGLNPQFTEYKTYSDLRDNLYRIIASSRSGKVQLQFKNGDEIVAALSGSVSKFETSLFEKKQEVLLTVTCDEPMLRAVEPVELVIIPPPPPV